MPEGGGGGESDSKNKNIIPEHPFISHIELAVAASPLNALTFYLPGAIKIAAESLRGGLPLAVSGGVGETLGYRLSQSIGLNVPKVTLRERKPCKATQYVKKITGGWVLSEPVPNAIPLYYLLDSVGENNTAHDLLRDKFENQILKACPVSRKDYIGFPMNPDTDLLLKAKWDSPQRLLCFAFRAFLFCTYPHVSNLLLNTKGDLWMIDHATILWRDNEDILQLHRAVKNRNPVVMEACRQISRITEDDIRQ